MELVGYGKTQLLAPGASETVKVEVPEYFLTSYDTFNSGVFILEDGTHIVVIGFPKHGCSFPVTSGNIGHMIIASAFIAVDIRSGLSM